MSIMSSRRSAGTCIGAVVLLGIIVGLPEVAFGQAAAPSTEGVRIDGQYGPFLPPDLSEHGYQIDRLIHVMHWFMALLFVGWGIFFVYCLTRFRQRTGHAATHELIKAAPTKWGEIGVAAFEAVLLIGFSIPVWGSIKNDLPEDEDPVRVRVIAEQFAWTFHYPGEDGIFGKTAPQFVDPALNPAGRDMSDPNGQDDIVAGELHIPDGRPVICEITSKDVIHSFSVPVLRVKQDAIPGMRIPIWFKAREGVSGTYEVACAQLCGNNHYNMKALLVIEPESEFEAWLKEKGTVELFDEDEV